LFLLEKTKNLFEEALAHWNELQSLGILVLPDSSTLKGEAIVKDGVSYVFEISDGRKYRAYHYGNPKYQNWPEAKSVVDIHEILIAEIISRVQ
jgi:hypothetical protein